MRVVVSKNKVSYGSSFVKVGSLKEVSEMIGTIDVLVYNNSRDTSEERVRLLGELKDTVGQMIYICNESDLDLAVKMIVIGSGGKYFDDEFFLESADELMNLVESVDEVTALAELGGVNVLCDFLNRYLQSGNSGNFTKGYLSIVKSAVNTLIDDYNQKNLEIVRMSETATEIFANTVALLSNMKRESASLQSIVDRMSSRADEQMVQQSYPRRAGSSVMFFPRVTYLKEKTIVRIKEVGCCRYLMSFMMGFRGYLENIRNVRPKLIVITPVGQMYEKLYEDYSWVTHASIKSSVNYYKNIVFTNCPNKDVLMKLLDDNNFDIFIVVDKTVNSKDHILNSKGISVKYAVEGLSCIKKLNIPLENCFSSVTEIAGGLFTIPLYPNYPVDVGARERFYLSEMQDQYEKLLVGVRRV